LIGIPMVSRWPKSIMVDWNSKHIKGLCISQLAQPTTNDIYAIIIIIVIDLVCLTWHSYGFKIKLTQYFRMQKMKHRILLFHRSNIGTSPPHRLRPTKWTHRNIM
jgi:hypothetical protein